MRGRKRDKRMRLTRGMVEGWAVLGAAVVLAGALAFIWGYL